MCFSKLFKALQITMLIMFSSLAMGQITYKLSLDADKITYRVFMKSAVAYSGSQARIGSAQITIVVTHGATNKFIVSNIKGKSVTNIVTGITNEMLWSSTKVEAPNENKNADYISFGFNNSVSPILFDILANQEIEILSFKNTGTCLGVVSLFENLTDPFKSPNSVNSNPGNSISIAGFGFGNAYSANFGGSVTCLSTASDLNVIPSGSGSITVGSNYSLMLTANNIGTASTSGMYQIQANLPSGITFINSVGSGWTCSSVNQANGTSVVTCQNSGVLNISASSSAVLNLSAANSLANGSTVSISGNVSGGGEVNTTNNNFIWNPNIINNSLPNLTGSISGSSNISAGIQTSYTVSLSNVGSASSVGQYSVQLTLPAGLAYNSFSGTGWNVSATNQANGSTLISAISSSIISAGASGTPLIFSVTPSASLAGGITLLLDGFVAGGGDNTTSNNSFTFSSAVINNTNKPDLKVLINGASNIVSGIPANFTFDVQNIGTAISNGVYSLTTTLPSGYTFNSYTGSNWFCNSAPVNNTTQVSCQSSAPIAINGSASLLTLNLTPNGSPQTNLIINSVVSGGGDGNTNNNSASFSSIIGVSGGAFLNTSMSGSSNLPPNVPSNFTVNITNGGTNATSGTYYSTTFLPQGFTFNSSSGNGWSCNSILQVNNVTKVVCQSSTPINAGGTGTPLVLNITPTISNPTNNFTIINSDITGGGSSNFTTNFYNFYTQIQNSADLELSMSVSSKTPNLGQSLTYTIVLTNKGPVNASNINVLTSLPLALANVIFNQIQNGNPQNANYNPATGYWIVPNLNANQSISLVITGIVNQRGIYFPTAEITLASILDVDSVFGNGNEFEDDFARVCFTVPINICSSETYTVTIPSIFTNIKWYRNGILIQGATSNSYSISQAGNYSFTSNVSCPSGGCCDIIVQQGSAPSISITQPTSVCNSLNLSSVPVRINNVLVQNGLTYYLSQSDAQNATNALLNTTITASGTYWVRYQAFGECSTIGSINVNFTKPNISVQPTYTTCQGALLSSIPVYSNGNLVTSGLTYYFSEADANTGINPITNTIFTISGLYWIRYQTPAGCFNVVSVNVSFSMLRPPKPNVADQTPPCPAMYVNLLSIQPTTTIVSGGVYEWHTANTPASPLVSNPQTVGTGTYYIFEKSANQCYSEGDAVVVMISDCCKPNICVPITITRN